MDVNCSKSTYQYVTDNPTSIIHRHIKYMKENNFAVPSNMEELPCVYFCCLSCIKLLLAQDLLLPRIGVQRNLYLVYLLHVSILLLCILRNIVTVYLEIQV